jgi:hypothetical protein
MIYCPIIRHKPEHSRKRRADFVQFRGDNFPGKEIGLPRGGFLEKVQLWRSAIAFSGAKASVRLSKPVPTALMPK